ncbi:Predicted neuraminidase (sialidase) [uncultured Ruminococcus sp.]|jgi:hypothetical protein|nr:Predicted neuraminidase (sialidase) [uncultured Clostridium sp.]SCI45508.1 Predicted neuraminidase (sialidase) [uncultured Ruminococcus sp.]
MKLKKFDELYSISPGNIPNQGIMFVDHSKQNRSGHLGHALIQCKNFDILAFYPDCSNDGKGHSAVGWMKYKRSGDFGKTWGPSFDLTYSKNMIQLFHNISVMSEKGVVTKDGSIVLFHLLCDIADTPLWEPYFVPTYTISRDNGITWSIAQTIGQERGRIYDALYQDETIFVLKFNNDATIDWTGNLPEHQYQLYVSSNNAKTFEMKSILPFQTNGRGYGTICFLENHDLIAYCYNINDEYYADYVISHDNGKTWDPPKSTYFTKKIRNPQMVKFGQGYLLHGRSGNQEPKAGNFVLYYSTDGIHWDNGRYLALCEAGYGAYSNNLIVRQNDGKERLFIQSSHAYEENKTNILSWWIDSK